MRLLSLAFLLCTTFFICAFTYKKADTLSIQNKKVPSMVLQTLEDAPTNITDVLNKEGYTIVVFWATWVSPSKRELNTINEKYETWQKETGVKLIAISLDDARNKSKVAPFVTGKGWEFEVYHDAEQLSKESFGVQNLPHTLIINKEQEIVWEKSDYGDDEEEQYIEFIREQLSKK